MSFDLVDLSMIDFEDESFVLGSAPSQLQQIAQGNRLTARLTDIETTPSSTKLTDCKLALYPIQLEGFHKELLQSSTNNPHPQPTSSCFPWPKMIQYYLTIKINEESRQYRLLKVNNHSDCYHILGQSLLWNFADYYGHNMIEFTLLRKSTWKTKVLGHCNMTLQSLYDQQFNTISHSTNESLDSEWLYELSIPLEMKSHVKSKKTWLFPQKQTPSTTSQGHTSLLSKHSYPQKEDIKYSTLDYEISQTNNPSNPRQTSSTTSPPRIVIKFRLIILQLSLRLVYKLQDDHKISDFHYLITKLPSSLIVDIMKTLAWRNTLVRVLSLTSSFGWNALDFALRAGKSDNVLELLQRTGKLCFPILTRGRASPLHSAVVGGSYTCLEYLIRFLKRYQHQLSTGNTTNNANNANNNTNNNNNIGNTTTINNTNISLEYYLTWKDHDEHTPFSLACHLNINIRMIEQLILILADVSYVHPILQMTPLMFAVKHGNYDTVITLLALFSDEIDAMDQVLVPKDDLLLSKYMSRNRRNANWRSRSGAYSSHLGIYRCLPSYANPSTGKQAIHLAVEHGHQDIVLTLLGIGISCLECDLHGNNVFHQIILLKNQELFLACIAFEEKRWKQFIQYALPQQSDNLLIPIYGLFMMNIYGKTSLTLALESQDIALIVVVIQACMTIYQDYLPTNIKEYLITLQQRIYQAMEQYPLTIGKICSSIFTADFIQNNHMIMASYSPPSIPITHLPASNISSTSHSSILLTNHSIDPMIVIDDQIIHETALLANNPTNTNTHPEEVEVEGNKNEDITNQQQQHLLSLMHTLQSIPVPLMQITNPSPMPMNIDLLNLSEDVVMTNNHEIIDESGDIFQPYTSREMMKMDLEEYMFALTPLALKLIQDRYE